MLHDTYIRISGKKKQQRNLVITGVINPDREECSYEFTDMDTGEEFDISQANLRDYVKDTILRRFDTSYVRRKYERRYVEEDQYEPIIKHLKEFGLFPFHLLKNKAA
jgi:hypothetical protein